MNAARSLARLRRLGKAFTTGDAAIALGAETSAATQTLKRLSAAGLTRRIRHGLWTTEMDLDPLCLVEYLTAPFPAYVSFQSALSLRGMVSQIPSVVYVASLARTRTLKTALGTFSVHRLAPRFFGGYETLEPSGVRMATPEKALLDVLYLGQSKRRLFAHLPEVELPRAFSMRSARRWIARIPVGPRRVAVERRLQAITTKGSSENNLYILTQA